MPEHGEILEKLGAEVVYPERDIAIRLAHRLETSKILDYVQLSEKVNISKMLSSRKSGRRNKCWRSIRGSVRKLVLSVRYHCH